MNEIDWSKAPEGTTHYVVGSINPFEKRVGDDWFYYVGGTWSRVYGKGDDRIASSSLAVVLRPATPSWSGEGLPPVGIDIEVLHELYGWIGARVVGQDGEAAIVRTNDGYAGVFQHQIRPIRTPEQIAADERDKAAHELFRSAWPETHSWGDLSPHWQEAFYRLADAGYRKP